MQGKALCFLLAFDGIILAIDFSFQLHSKHATTFQSVSRPAGETAGPCRLVDRVGAAESRRDLPSVACRRNRLAEKERVRCVDFPVCGGGDHESRYRRSNLQDCV